MFLLFTSLRNIPLLVKWNQAKPGRIFCRWEKLFRNPNDPRPAVAIRVRNVYIYTVLQPVPRQGTGQAGHKRIRMMPHP